MAAPGYVYEGEHVAPQDFVPAEMGDIVVGDDFSVEVKEIGPCHAKVVAVYEHLRIAVALALSDDFQERRFVEIDLTTLKRPPTLH
jgi:hypothetical protein